MKYKSTRGVIKDVSFEQTVFAGYAPDGGIYLPNIIPKFSEEELYSLRTLSYYELAERILHIYIDESEIPRDILKGTYVFLVLIHNVLSVKIN